MEIIDRALYEQSIAKVLGKGEVIVLTGHRRAGKSSILERMAQILSSKGNVIRLDMENPDNEYITTYKELNQYIKESLSEEQHNDLLIDEVQEIAEFERTLRFWVKQDGMDILVTGSNAYMLSGELATIFAGRHEDYHIYSLDYEEFIKFYRLKDSDEALTDYMRWGGLPFLHRIPLDDTRSRIDYLGGIYHTIFMKDIVQRQKVRNITLLDNLAHFIADNSGKLFSSNSIAKYLKKGISGTSPNTIDEYTRYLCDAYLIDRVSRYDIRGKRIFEQQEKFYFEDIGIRNFLCKDKRNTDIEKIMENIVYLRLKQLGFDVYVGQLNGKEIDFVAKKGDDIRYFQVTVSVASEETYEREYGNLKLIRDNYPKFVITMDPTAELVQDSGIITLSLRNFLTTKQ